MDNDSIQSTIMQVVKDAYMQGVADGKNQEAFEDGLEADVNMMLSDVYKQITAMQAELAEYRKKAADAALKGGK